MEIKKEELEALEASFKKVVDESFEAKAREIVGPMAAAEVRSTVEKMRLDRHLFGKDVTGLSLEQKADFAQGIKAIAFGQKVKTSALIEEQDSNGGYLVAAEMANAILRIAASVGLVMSQSTKWPMKSDELDIPGYSGSFLTGAYLGVDTAGSITGIAFNMARLLAKKWQLAFAVGNDLLADASQDLADWLLAFAGEALANMIDNQGFVGTGNPFVGVTKHPSVAAYSLTGSATGGSTHFADFDLVVDASDVIAQLEESILDGAAFYFNRTVWAKIRSQKDDAGNFILPWAGASQLITVEPMNGAPKMAGSLMGFPVYTCRHLPLNSATAVSTIFGVFGNFKAGAAYGDKGDMRLEQYKSGAFGGKEIALADQTGMVMKHRHGFVVSQPGAFVNIKTDAS